MSDTRDPLDRIAIATPCSMDWDAMTGDERRRFCGACRLHVHDLSQMTRAEARALLAGSEGRVCVRLYRRPDGRVLTKDCVTVRERLRRRARRLRVAAAAAFAFLVPFAPGCGRETQVGDPTTGTVAVPEDGPEIGDVCVDPPADGGGEDLRPTMGEVDVRPELGRVAPAHDDGE